MLKFENKLNGRFYYFDVAKDMLNDCVLRIIYGGKHCSRTRVMRCDCKESIDDEIQRLVKVRLRHGYVLTD